jgi:hypothetical protein
MTGALQPVGLQSQGWITQGHIQQGTEKVTGKESQENMAEKVEGRELGLKSRPKGVSMFGIARKGKTKNRKTEKLFKIAFRAKVKKYFL